MIENIDRNVARPAWTRCTAACRARGRSASPSSSISLSLVAAFIPLIFMGGIVGRFFREFSLTLAFAIAVSTVVSLTVTPMICAHCIGPAHPGTRAGSTGWSRACWPESSSSTHARWSPCCAAAGWALLVLLGTVAATVFLYIQTPKGFIPEGETGLLFGFTEASTDISFPAMSALQRQVAEIDPG